jgi:hypothetical protein
MRDWSTRFCEPRAAQDHVIDGKNQLDWLSNREAIRAYLRSHARGVVPLEGQMVQAWDGSWDEFVARIASQGSRPG